MRLYSASSKRKLCIMYVCAVTPAIFDRSARERLSQKISWIGPFIVDPTEWMRFEHIKNNALRQIALFSLSLSVLDLYIRTLMMAVTIDANRAIMECHSMNTSMFTFSKILFFSF